MPLSFSSKEKDIKKDVSRLYFSNICEAKSHLHKGCGKNVFLHKFTMVKNPILWYGFWEESSWLITSPDSLFFLLHLKNLCHFVSLEWYHEPATRITNSRHLILVQIVFILFIKKEQEYLQILLKLCFCNSSVLSFSSLG